jgi:predicted RNase H-like nuclease
MTKYRISKKSVSESVWAVVEAVNNLDEFIIEYPDSEEVQLEIARNF